jgi:protein ImuB
MPIAEALAIEGRLEVEEEDRESDARALEQLAVWMERYSPMVSLEEGAAPSSLLLDISGCASCFRGEDRLLRQAVRELGEAGWTARIAIADTPGAAWGLAHHARTPCLAPPGATERVMRSLPLAALRVPGEALAALLELGIREVDQLLKLERASIPSRFGEEVLQRIDQALGRAPEPLKPYRHVPEARVRSWLGYATDRLPVLLQALESLCERLEALLRRQHWGARQVECCLYSETGKSVRFEVGLCRASHSARHIGMLLRARLERVRVEEPVSGMCVHALAWEPVVDCQAEFFETEPQRASAELALLIDRLSSRLGHEAVARATLVPDAQPEHACRFEPVQLSIEDAKAKAAKRLKSRTRPSVSRRPPVDAGFFWHRPLRLWPAPIRIEVMSVVPDGPPIKFRWAAREHAIAQACGPERIETGWWRGHDVRRDYYRVVTRAGTRYWIFRRRDDGQWFLHGCFD